MDFTRQAVVNPIQFGHNILRYEWMEINMFTNILAIQGILAEKIKA